MKKILMAVLLLGFAGSAYAQSAVENKLELGLGLNYGIPMASDFEDDYDSALGLQLFADYKLVDSLSLGFDYYHSFGYDGPFGIDLDSAWIGLRLKYAFPVCDKLNAYGLLGLAAYQWEADGEDDHSKVGFNIGIGADYDIAEQVFIGMDVRYHFSGEYEDVDSNHMTIGLHGGYRF